MNLGINGYLVDREVLKVGTLWDQCFDATLINGWRETKDNKFFTIVEDTKCTCLKGRTEGRIKWREGGGEIERDRETETE